MRPPDQEERVAAALYIRSACGDPGNTLQVQLEALQRYARRNELDSVRVYFDVRGSRTQFERMMAEAEEVNPGFRCILVAAYDRFAGLGEGFQGWMQRLTGKGISVVSITDPPGGSVKG